MNILILKLEYKTVVATPSHKPTVRFPKIIKFFKVKMSDSPSWMFNCARLGVASGGHG